jgi:hypothetical protein
MQIHNAARNVQLAAFNLQVHTQCIHSGSLGRLFHVHLYSSHANTALLLSEHADRQKP